MSRLAILAPFKLLLLSGIVVAQISAPDCVPTSQLQWSYNSLDQNPCLVTAYLLSTCLGGSDSVQPLGLGEWYTILDGGNLCLCNTVAYSLYSACGACQQATWTTWSEYSTNCTNKMPVSSFPYPFLTEHVCLNGLSLMSHSKTNGITPSRALSATPLN
ncbi:hypothetical protein BJV78DRAFT_1356115 [Lactifluus subvellereus]|nr:hypothetical protein BJV78DRAFT_1356115 [Lactifluus subvellereus]